MPSRMLIVMKFASTSNLTGFCEIDVWLRMSVDETTNNKRNWRGKACGEMVRAWIAPAALLVDTL